MNEVDMENHNLFEMPPGMGHNNPPLGELPDEALVNVRFIRPLAGNPSNPTLWRWIKKGTFPEPERRTGPAQCGNRLWRLGTFRQWLRGEWVSP